MLCDLMSLGRLCKILPLVLTLVGCATGDNSSTNVSTKASIDDLAQLPKAWKTAADAESTKGNTTSSPNSVPNREAHQITVTRYPELAALVRSVSIENSLELQTAQNLIDQQRAVLKQTRAGLFPVIRAVLQRAGSDNPGSGFVSSHQGQLSVSGQFDVWGERRSLVQRDALLLQASEFDRNAVEAAIKIAVVELWAQGSALRAHQKLLRAAGRRYEKILQAERRKVDMGIGAEALLVQVSAQQKLVCGQIESLQATLENLKTELNLLVGRALDDTSISFAASLPERPALPDQLASSDLLLNQPTLKAAKLRYLAALKEHHSTQMARWPQFSYDLSGLGSDSSLSQALDPSRWIWSAMVQAGSTLWDAGERKAVVSQAHYEAEAARLAYQQSILNVVKDIASQRRLYLAADQQASNAASAVGLLSQSVDDALRRLNLGASDWVIVWQLELQLINAQHTEVSAVEQQWQAWTRLANGVGRLL